MQEIYEGKRADGSVGYFQKEGEGWKEVPKPIDLNAEIGKTVENAKQRYESSGTLLPRFDLEGNDPTYAFKLGANGIAQLLDMVPSAAVGAGQLAINAKDILGALGDSTKEKGAWETAKTVGGSMLEEFKKERFTREGFESNPLTIPLDVLSLGMPLLKGEGLGSAIKSIGNLKSALREKAIARYAGNAANESLLIPELQAGAASTPLEAIKHAKSLGMEVPTMGQISGKTNTATNELFSPGLSDKINKQNQGITKAVTTLLEQPSLNGTRQQITLANSTSEATGILRDSIVRGVKQAQDAIGKELQFYTREMANTLGLKKTSDAEVLRASEALLSVKRGSSQFNALSPKDKSTYARLQTLSEQYSDANSRLNAINNDRVTRNITSSENLVNKNAPAPINFNPNADHTRMIDDAFKSHQQFKKFVATPGVGKENAAQLLMFRIANKAKVKDTDFFDPKVLADLITNKDNAAMFREVLEPSKRVGLQNVAYTLRKYATYSPSEVESMAFSLNRAKDAATLNVSAAALPMLLGGGFAQMRAGYGFANAGRLKLQGNVLGQLLISEPWVMEALMRTPKNSPALGSRMKQLVKAMGQLHIPAIFEINGEEVEVPRLLINSGGGEGS